MENPTRLQLVAAAIEINKHGGKIKNPRFIATSKLKEGLLTAVVDDWEKLSDATMQVMLAIGANVSMGEATLPDDLTSRKALEIAAKEMNEVMGLEPGIDLSLPDKEFHKIFVKATKIVAGTDEFSDFTWSVLEANNLGPKRVVPVDEDAQNTEDVTESSQEYSSCNVVDQDKPAKKVVSKKKYEQPKVEEVKKERVTIISYIRRFLNDRYATDNKQFTKDEILNQLVENFPDNPEDGMRTTVRYLLTCKRGLQSKGYKFERVDSNAMKILQIPA